MSTTRDGVSGSSPELKALRNLPVGFVGHDALHHQIGIDAQDAIVFFEGETL